MITAITLAILILGVFILAISMTFVVVGTLMNLFLGSDSLIKTGYSLAWVGASLLLGLVALMMLDVIVL